MSGYQLAVYCCSQDYINRFLTYCRNGRTSFTVRGFTNIGSMSEYVNSRSVDILLFCQNSFADTGTKEDEEHFLREVSLRSHMQKLIILGERQDTESEPAMLNMYQPMSTLMSEIERIADSLYADESSVSACADLTGIYSLDGAPDICRFALSLADSPPFSSSRILFVDLDRFSAMGRQIDSKSRGTLTDLIYYYKTSSDRLKEQLSVSVLSAGNLFYLAAPASPSDLDEIQPSKWKAFFDLLAACGRYDSIFINITDYCRDLIQLFDICRTIYLFSSDYRFLSGYAASAGMSAGADLAGNHIRQRGMSFIEYLSENGREDIFRKFADGFAFEEKLSPVDSKSHKKNREKWKKAI